MVMPSARARKGRSSVPCAVWNLPGLRVPMQSRPAGAPALTAQPQQRRRAHQPRAVAEELRDRPRSPSNSSDVVLGAEHFSTVPGLEDLRRPDAQLAAASAALRSTADRDDVGVEQHREIGGHDLDQLLEAVRAEHGQRGGVHARLAREIGARRARSSLPCCAFSRVDLGALTLQHEVLHVDDALAASQRGRRQHAEKLGIARPGNRDAARR